jgi:plasmid stabilization system protein ParE
MSFELFLSREAERCVHEQLRWYEADDERGGEVLADRWLVRLESTLNKLTEQPRRHGFAPENGRWMSHLEIRQFRFRPWKTPSAWRVLYVIDEARKTVTVLQIRHASRPFLI